MEKIFEGKTEQDAVENALKEFGVSLDSIDIEVLSKTKKGLFGLNNSVTIRATVIGLPTTDDGGEHTISTSAPNVSKKALPEITDEIKKHVQQFVLELIQKMGIDISDVVFSITDDIYVNLYITEAEDQNLLIGKYGKNLDALQVVVNAMLQSLYKEQNIRIVLDIEQYRIKRIQQLQDTAIKKAEQVLQSGKSCLLESLGPFDRKKIHDAIMDIEGVATESEGRGHYKRIRVFLV